MLHWDQSFHTHYYDPHNVLQKKSEGTLTKKAVLEGAGANAK
jgi:hypothetical protein